METTKARLNPFLFPPDTNFRFILLIVSVVGSSVFAYYTLHNQLYSDELFSGLQKCLSDAEATYPLQGLEPGSSEYLNQANLNYQFNNNCIEPLEQDQAGWILKALAVLLVVAGIIYWCMPALRIWWDKLTVFSAEDDPDILNYLLNLCKEVGLSKSPRFRLRALNPSPSGLAFGHLGRYDVVLNGGLITLFYRDRERFRVILLHELAHIRNKDIDKTYFSLGLGISFFIVTLIPLFFGNLVSLLINFWGGISYILWQFLGAVIYIPIIYITLTSILRSREAYADARVLALNPQNEILRNELISLSSPKDNFLTRLFRLHPDPAWRLNVFDRPQLLFGLTEWDAFLSGFISTFALRELDNFLSILLPPKYENFSLFGASLFFVPFVVAVVGLGVWQRVFVDQVHGKKLQRFGRSGISLGLGMLMGILLSFSAFVNNSIVLIDSSTRTVAIFGLLLGILFLISLFFFFRWIAIGASVWLETVTDPINLQQVTFFGLLITGLVMSLWTGGFYLLQQFGYDAVFVLAFALVPSLQRVSTFAGLGLSLYTESIVSYLILAPILLTPPILLSTILWIFPLLSKSRKSRTSLQNIFLGDHGIVALPAKIHPQLHPFLAFLISLAVATVFTMIVAFLRIVLHFSVDESVLTTPQWSFNFKIFQILTAIFVQVMLAVIVSISFKQLGWAHGLFAAFVAGCLISIGLIILPEIGDCVAILRLGTSYSCSNFLEADFSFWLGSIIILGTFFSMLPAFIMSWVSNGFRNLLSKPSPS